MSSFLVLLISAILFVSAAVNNQPSGETFSDIQKKTIDRLYNDPGLPVSIDYITTLNYAFFNAVLQYSNRIIGKAKSGQKDDSLHFDSPIPIVIDNGSTIVRVEYKVLQDLWSAIYFYFEGILSVVLTDCNGIQSIIRRGWKPGVQDFELITNISLILFHPHRIALLKHLKEKHGSDDVSVVDALHLAINGLHHNILFVRLSPSDSSIRKIAPCSVILTSSPNKWSLCIGTEHSLIYVMENFMKRYLS